MRDFGSAHETGGERREPFDGHPFRFRGETGSMAVHAVDQPDRLSEGLATYRDTGATQGQEPAPYDSDSIDYPFAD